MRLLILEDEQKTQEYLRRGLIAAGYIAEVFSKPSQATEAMAGNHFDALLVDVNLPERLGWDFVKEARNNGFSGVVILLTALSGLEDKIRGLDSGADDYLTKPFSIDELLARLRAHFRKKGTEIGALLKYEEIQLDIVKRKVKRSDCVLDLSVKEFALLEFFLRNPERPLSRAQIAEHVWNIDFDSGSNVIDVYVNHLRKKLEQCGPRIIHTIMGVGYELRKK